MLPFFSACTVPPCLEISAQNGVGTVHRADQPTACINAGDTWQKALLASHYCLRLEVQDLLQVATVFILCPTSW